MIDQYNMDQYNKETSQIHAPADLIRRTKEAVRAEEQRLAEENLKQHAVTQPKHTYAKVYRWALPVAAAIFCVVLLNVGLLRFRKDMSESGSSSATTADTSSSTTASGGVESNDMGFPFEVEETYEQAEEAAKESVDGGSNAMDMAEGVMPEADNGVHQSTAADAGGTGYVDAAASAEDDVYEDAASKEMGEEESGGYIDSIYGSALWIDQVDEAPSFYGGSGAEMIAINDIRMYVAKDTDDTWIAYAQIGEEQYVISGELTEADVSREEFIEKAYQLLNETIESAE